MKTLTCISILLLSASAMANQSEPAKIEVCFVLDTTGSMSGLIEGAKQKIWSIANELIATKPTPELKLGLVGYRDIGDDFVTKPHALTDDIDLIYSKLLEFQAGGGGDTPEAVNEALADAIKEMKWSDSEDVLKIIFLVGDAPAQMKYDGPKYPELCEQAAKRGILINTIQCGGASDTMAMWKEIAKLSEGEYAAIEQSGNMAVITTPLDARLAELNKEVGNTLVAYGDARMRTEMMGKQSLSESASAPAAAERLKFNTGTGKVVQGGGELIDALNEGSLKLDAVDKKQLPKELADLNDSELKAEIEKRSEKRRHLQNEIVRLSKERDQFIAQERKKNTGTKDSFDARVATTIREQAERKGIQY